MQVLIDEDKRAGGYAPDGMEWEYPDPRWQIITFPDEVIGTWTEDMVHYRWDGKKFIYDPKTYPILSNSRGIMYGIISITRHSNSEDQ